MTHDTKSLEVYDSAFARGLVKLLINSNNEAEIVMRNESRRPSVESGNRCFVYTYLSLESEEKKNPHFFITYTKDLQFPTRQRSSVILQRATLPTSLQHYGALIYL